MDDDDDDHSVDEDESFPDHADEVHKEKMKLSTRQSREKQRFSKTSNIGNYQLSNSVGEGTFGKVKLGKHFLTGEKVAIKILEKDRIADMADVERVAREIKILKMIRHPNIV